MENKKVRDRYLTRRMADEAYVGLPEYRLDQRAYIKKRSIGWGILGVIMLGLFVLDSYYIFTVPAAIEFGYPTITMALFFNGMIVLFGLLLGALSIFVCKVFND